MQLVIDRHGTVRCVYDETINLAALGTLQITRGSHVEPTTDGRWTADLTVVNGPTLGPFTHRSEALSAERTWLDDHWLIRTLTSEPTSSPGSCFARSAYPSTTYREAVIDSLGERSTNPTARARYVAFPGE